jgi:hypothetical protein
MPTYYFVNPTNANLSWSLASSWATSSGGTAGTLSFPTASDDVLFDASSGTGTCSIFVAASCRSLDFTGYSGTINFPGQLLTLTSSASTLASQAKLVLSSTMNMTGSGAISAQGLRINGSYQITSSGKIWERSVLSFSVPGTASLADNLIVSGGLYFIGTGTTNFRSSNTNVTASIAGNLETSATLTVNFTGIPVIFTGSAVQSMSFSNGTLRTPSLTIDKSPTSRIGPVGSAINFSTDAFELKGGILSFSTSFPLVLNASSSTGVQTFKTNGNIVGFSGSELRLGMGAGTGRSLTLLDDLKLFSGSALRIKNDTGTQTINGPGDFYFGDGTNVISTALTFNTGLISGSARLLLQGSGSLTWTLGSAGGPATSYFIASPMVINMVGTLAFSNSDNSFPYGHNTLTNSPTLTYTAGTIGSIILRPANCTLQTSGITWNQVLLAVANSNVRLNNTLQATTITVSVNTTFTGSAGFTASNYTQTTAGTIATFQNGNSYLVTNTLQGIGTATLAGTQFVFFRASSSNAPRAIFTLSNTGTQQMIFASGSWIDSSQGQTIYTVGGGINNTINWNPTGTTPTGSAYVFVN